MFYSLGYHGLLFKGKNKLPGQNKRPKEKQQITKHNIGNKNTEQAVKQIFVDTIPEFIVLNRNPYYLRRQQSVLPNTALFDNVLGHTLSKCLNLVVCNLVIGLFLNPLSYIFSANNWLIGSYSKTT